MNTLKLILCALTPVAATALLYHINRYTRFSKLKYKTKQLIYGLVFGALAVLGTEFGIDIDGAIINTRDASVLTASFVFGAPAGIIAAVIGSVERYFCVYWGGGEYTQLACALSTLIVGFISAGMNRFLLDRKKPPVLFALSAGIMAEVLHMMMIFLTHLSDISLAFAFVKSCALPMVIINGIACMLSVLVTMLAGMEKERQTGEGRRIAILAQRRLLVCVLFAFITTSTLTFTLQSSVSRQNAEQLMMQNIGDVEAEITHAVNENLLMRTKRIATMLPQTRDLQQLAEESGISEIVVVNDEGIITKSTNEDFIGYNMADGEQSGEFMVLLSGTESYVQSFRAISLDSQISRKYAGVALKEGGFVQAGYGPGDFQRRVADEIIASIAFRHVGKDGYLLIADSNNIVINGEQSGKTLQELGLTQKKEDTGFWANLQNTDVYYMSHTHEAFTIIAVLPKSEIIIERDLSVYMMMFMEIMSFVGLYLLTYYLIKKLVVDNIQSVNESLSRIVSGNLNEKVNVRSNVEFASLSDDINATVETLKAYIVEAEARIDRELELAMVIQESSLPGSFRAHKNVDIYASMHTAKEVGGDFYDFYMLDDHHIAFLIADVSGKGITAAMFMMKAKALIKSLAEQGGEVSQIIAKANNELCEGNDAQMFVTCWMGILDLASGKLQFCNAGHNPPLLRRAGGAFEFCRERHGFVLGSMENGRYRQGEMTLAQGDVLYLYTDGVTEANDESQKLYSDARLLSTLNQASAENAQAFCRAVKEDVDAFVGDAAQSDDITMLCIRMLQLGKKQERGEKE